MVSQRKFWVLFLKGNFKFLRTFGKGYWTKTTGVYYTAFLTWSPKQICSQRSWNVLKNCNNVLLSLYTLILAVFMFLYAGT